MDYCNEYFHNILGQSHEQFFRKCAASAETIRRRWKFNEVWQNLNQIWGSPNDNSNNFVQNARKVYGQSMARIWWKLNEMWPKVNQVCGTLNEYLHKVCPEMHRKRVVYQRPWNDWNSVKGNQKSMRFVDPTNKNFYQVWGQSHVQYVQKCHETKCIRDEGMNVRQFTWWRHQMETVSALLAICAGNSPARWILRTKASDAGLWCFLWSAPE